MKINYDFSLWEKYIPNIKTVIEKMDLKPIMSVGITPYTRIVPSFFLEKYSIFTIQRSSDVDVMEEFVRIHTLEDKYPDIAKRVRGTGYLTGNFAFQRFLKSFSKTPKLLFYTLTEKIINDLDTSNIEWIGNHPNTFKDVQYKGTFRSLVKNLGLDAINFFTFSREEFTSKSFEELFGLLSGEFVVQRSDKETGGNEGTFFINTKEDFIRTQKIFLEDESFSEVVVTPFIVGHSVSMLGCVMPDRVLSGPIQLQFIDVPESLNGINANGIFFGNDLNFADWDESIEESAQVAVEKIGEHMRNSGYKGIFGIDFLYDKKRNKIYPNECNPRFTGSLLLYSLALLEAGIPPFEFFHLAVHLGIDLEYDEEKLIKELKKKRNYSHISFSPKGIETMQSDLIAGIYNYNRLQNRLYFKGQKILLSDLKDRDDFIVIDTVQKRGDEIQQNVPRLFKLIFPYSIGMSSYKIEERAGFLVRRFATYLKQVSDEYVKKIHKKS